MGAGELKKALQRPLPLHQARSAAGGKEGCGGEPGAAPPGQGFKMGFSARVLMGLDEELLEAAKRGDVGRIRELLGRGGRRERQKRIWRYPSALCG